MSIKVKGIIARSDELSYDMEIPFSNLTVKGQERLFLENKDLFICEALKSKYDYIRDLVRTNFKSCSSEALNEAIKFLLSGYTNCDLIMEILATSNLVLEDDVRISLSESDYWQLRQWVAYDTNTSLDLLYKMLIPAVQSVFWHHNFTILDALISNTNFEISESLKYIIDSIYEKDKNYPELLNKASELSKTISDIKENLSKQ